MRTTLTPLTVAVLISLCASLTAHAAPPADVQSAPPLSKATAATVVPGTIRGRTSNAVAVPPAVSSAGLPAAPPVAPPAAPSPPAAVAVPPAVAAIKPPVAPVAEPSASILERFRTYTGPRTPAALAALFTTSTKAVIRQYPEIALSNGATSVTVEAVIAAAAGTAPNIAFNGARMLSNKRTPKGVWQIVALPDTGALQAELIVLTDTTTNEIPLNIAPQLPMETDLSEKGFSAFLASKDAATKQQRDFNGDGRNDYRDDYIFAANYLVNKSSGAPVRGAEDTRTTKKWDQQTAPPQQVLKELQEIQTTGAAKAAGPTPSTQPAEQGAWQPTSAGGTINSGTAATATATTQQAAAELAAQQAVAQLAAQQAAAELVAQKAAAELVAQKAAAELAAQKAAAEFAAQKAAAELAAQKATVDLATRQAAAALLAAQQKTGTTANTGGTAANVQVLSTPGSSVTTTYIGSDSNSLNQRNQNAKVLADQKRKASQQ